MNTIWLDEPPMYEYRDYKYDKYNCDVKNENESIATTPEIKYWRRTEFCDFTKLHRLTRMKTYDMFGPDVDPAKISEISCMSIVQINSLNDIVANISLCNYPNIPSVPCDGWINWISRHYGINGISERNTLFVHMLLWDVRYNDTFYKRLLDAVFISSIHTTRLIFIMPPWVTPVGFVEEHMNRIVPNGETDSYQIQALYISLRHMHCPRLKIRRVVEEDNDDIISILNTQSEKFKELYGEYYISEMMRYPDGLRQMVVAETDGLANGVLCLNKIVDLQSLNQHFELTPYYGLCKPHLSDLIHFQENYTPCVHSHIIFPPVKEIKNLYDRFKVKTAFRFNEFHLTKEIYEHDLFDEDKTENIEFRSSNDEENSSANSEIRGFLKNSTNDLSIENTIKQEKLKTASSFDNDKNSSKSTLRLFGNMKSSLKNVRMDVNPIENYGDNEDYKSKEDNSNPCGNSKVEEKFSVETDVSKVQEINHKEVIRNDMKLPYIYHGETNAFTLELFSMKNDIDERFSHDYLEAAFECFPEQDYCVVLIPPLYPTFPLLQSFVRVPLQFDKEYPMVMYLAHRTAVIGEINIRDAKFTDIIGIEKLLADIPKGDKILNDFKNIFENPSLYFSYVFLCKETIVGFAMLCVESEIEFIRSYYRIDDFITFNHLPTDSHARIIHLTIMPIFANLHRYFFQQLIHLSNKHAIYYRLYHNDASAMTRTEPLNTFLGEMIPVLPRKNIKYRLKSNSENRQNNFALYMMVPKIASIPKIDVNIRVIVVGASDCGLSVLETLVFGPHASSINFTNITLISPNGIPFENRPDHFERDELPFRGRYSRDYRYLVGIRAWINVVHGTVTAIHRKDKFVTVFNSGSIFYDYLILTCGLQYQQTTKFIDEPKTVKMDLRNHQKLENYLTINNERDAAYCLNYCNKVLAECPTCSVIFYGENIDSYSSITMLINSGFPAENITLVKPPLDICERHNTTFYGNDEIEEAVMKAMKESGVNFIPDCKIVDWIIENYNEARFFIKYIILEQNGNRKEVSCDIFFNFIEKTIDMDTFFAISRSGLVFDGYLVIDPEFRTNDPCIFSAGTITKYSRRFYADEFSHRYYNPCEVGERLGQKLANIMYPKNSIKDFSQSEISKLDMILPVFKKPIITSCILPGGYFYMNVRKPGELGTDDNNNDIILITGYPASSIGYFRIHFNQFDTVETITCLSKKEFEIENYISLYGKHQTLLNDLKIRFQKSMVPDLYEYFREPWAVALFLDRFECLRVENRATLLSPTVVCGDTLIHDCTKALIKSKWDAMTPEDREIIETRYAGSVYQEELENCLIDFLQFSENYDVPIYCNPRFIRRLLYDIECLQDDPLFPKS